MPHHFSFEKEKIFLLYKYYLLNDKSWIKEEKNEKGQIDWLLGCLEKEEKLIAEIKKRLKEGWEFFRLPPLEKSILVFGSYEILYQKKVPTPLLIDQMIIFSKKYLEKDKYKYINKILDLITNEKQKI